MQTRITGLILGSVRAADVAEAVRGDVDEVPARPAEDRPLEMIRVAPRRPTAVGVGHQHPEKLNDGPTGDHPQGDVDRLLHGHEPFWMNVKLAA